MGKLSPAGTKPKPVKKPGFKVGEYVKVIKPTIVERIGYPLTPYLVYQELNTPGNRQRIIDMLSEFDVGPKYARLDAFSDNIPDPEVADILWKVAYHTVKTRHFGGNERSLHLVEKPDIKDCIFRIEAKKMAHTGSHVGPRGRGDDYEPGYLANEKVHQLLGLSCSYYPVDGIPSIRFNSNKYTWIQAENVQKVEDTKVD